MNRSAPSLRDLADPHFRLTVDGLTHDLDGILALSRHMSVPAAERILIPATDPLAALVGLETAWRAGAIPLPDARAEAAAPLPNLTPELSGPDAGAVWMLLATSGSTGAPRHPAFTFDAIAISARRIALYLGLGPGDVVAMQLPCDHGFGLIGQLLAAAAVGAHVVWCGGPFAEERARHLIGARPTVIAGVPHMLRQLKNTLEGAPAAIRDGVRVVGSAGGALHPVLLRELGESFPGAVVWNQYGCTEAGPRLTAMPSFHPAFYAGTVGRAIPGVRLWIEGAPGQPGRICFATDTAMVGYWGDPAATEEARTGDGWRTGDLGVIDELDRLHVLGRSDDVVKIRGEKVALQQVSQGAERAGATSAFTVFVPDRLQPMEGRLILVYEAPRPIDRLRIAAEMPPGGMPRRMLWWPALPRLSTGKLDRSAIEAVILAEES
jgi:long-chain acyl-CoA synthetase